MDFEVTIGDRRQRVELRRRGSSLAHGSTFAHRPERPVRQAQGRPEEFEGRQSRDHTERKSRCGTAWECWLDGKRLEADIVEARPGLFSILVEGQAFEVRVEREADRYRLFNRDAEFLATVTDLRRWPRLGRGRSRLAAEGRQEVQAPMPGKVIAVLVQEGQRVEVGHGLVVVEAMKMQNEIPAPKSGAVVRVAVRPGDTVEHGQTLVVVE